MNENENVCRIERPNFGEHILNVARIMKGSCLEGPGVRDVLWLQGCSIRCPGCVNQSYQSFEAKNLLRVDMLAPFFQYRRRFIEGVSIVGGEPTEQAPALLNLLVCIKAMGLSTVLYTGRCYSALKEDPNLSPLLNYTDLLIDGPFIEAEKDESLHWRGSKNQRLIRLSSYFTDTDLALPAHNGEVIISKNDILFHGVGALPAASEGLLGIGHDNRLEA